MYAVVHRTERLEGTVTVAGSKNYTARYILAASLASGSSVVQNPAPIDDAYALADCCTALVPRSTHLSRRTGTCRAQGASFGDRRGSTYAMPAP